MGAPVGYCVFNYCIESPTDPLQRLLFWYWGVNREVLLASTHTIAMSMREEALPAPPGAERPVVEVVKYS